MWFYSLMTLALGQEVQLSIDSNQIIVGVPTVLTVLATGFEEEPTPEVGEIMIQGRHRDAVDVDFLGVDPMVSRQTSIINGRRTDSVNVRYAYRYRLMVNQEGEYQIPTVQVTQDDVSATSAPGRFVVKEAPKTAEMAIELDMPKRSVWVGETIPLNIDVYLQRDIGDLSVVVPLFDEFPVQPNSSVKGTQEFTLTTVHGDINLPVVQERVRKDNKEYTRVRLMGETTLTKAGNITVPPSKILAQMVVGQQRGMLGFSRNQYQLFQATDIQKSLEVRPLPLKDKPESFSGAVGESFSMKLTANKTVVAVGEPIPLELEIRGKGNLEGIRLPDFEALGLDERVFETPKQAPLGIDNDEGGKVFSFSVRLKSSDIREIPVLDFGYFDPKAGQYQHAYTQPVALSVSGSKVISAAQVVSNEQQANTDVIDSTRENSLSISQFDLSWDDKGSVSNIPWWPITVVVHILGILIGLTLTWNERTRQDRAEKSAQRASKGALQKISKRVVSEPASEVSAQASQTLKGVSKEYPHLADTVRKIIADIEIESYSPKAKTTPLSDKVQAAIRNLLSTLMILWMILPIQVQAETPESSESLQTAYRVAMGLESHAERQQAMSYIQQQLISHVETYPEDAVAWSNLGTVSLQVFDRGQAVLAYKRAQRLGLEEDRIERNLNEINAGLPSWAQKKTQNVWTDALIWTSVPQTYQWLLFNCCGGILLVGWRYSIRYRLVLIPWVALGVGLCVSWLNTLEPLVVVMERSPLRSADHAQAPLVRNDWIPTGAQLTVVQSQSDWVQVQLPSGVQGWVPKSTVENL